MLGFLTSIKRNTENYKQNPGDKYKHFTVYNIHNLLQYDDNTIIQCLSNFVLFFHIIKIHKL